MAEKKKIKTISSVITGADATGAIYTFIKMSPYPYIIIEESGTIVFSNIAMDRLLLCRENSHTGLALVSLVAPAFRQKYFDVFRDLFSGALETGIKVQLIRENGSHLPVTLYRQVELAGENNARQCVVAVCDNLAEEHIAERVATLADQIERKAEEQIRALQATVQERERTEKTFREMQERQTLAFWGADMAWWEYAIPTDVFTMSSRISQILGNIYSPGSVPADDLLEHIYEEDRVKVVEAVRNHKEGKTLLLDVRIRVISHSCAWKWVLLRGRITEYDENNAPLRMVGIIQDINETKQFEDEHSLFFEHATDMFTIIDQDGVLQHINPAVEKCLGWTAQEMIGVPAITFTHPDDINNANVALELLSNGKTPPPVEQRVRCKDGTYRWLSTNVVPLPDHGLSIGIGRDITEQKEQDSRIQELNKSLEQRVAERSAELARQTDYLAEAMSIGQMAYWEYDLDTGEFIFDDAGYGVLRTTAAHEGGYRISASEFQKRFVISPDGPPLAECMANVHNADPQRLRSFEVSMRYGDGNSGYAMVRIRLERDENGSLIRVVGIAQDISAQKKVKADLERREQMYRSLFATSPMPIFVADTSTGTLIDANDFALEYVGVSFEELQKMHFTQLHDDASQEMVQSTFKSISASGRLAAITARLRHNSGVFRRVMIHTRAVACDDTVYAVAVMTDIDE